MATTATTDRNASQRADATTLVGWYVVLLTLIPARLVFAALPLDIRPCMVIGLGTGLVWFCAHLVHSLGMAKGFSWVRTVVYLFVVTQLVTYGYGTAQYLPGDELKSADRSILTIMSFIAVALLICDGVRSVERLNKLIKIVVVSSSIMAMIGLLQFFTKLDIASYLTLPGLRQVGSADFVLARDSLRRPAGTAGHPIEFGVVCAMTMPLAVYVALRAGVRAEPARRWWVLLAMVSVGAVVSLSRSAIIGLAVAAVVLLPTWPRRRRWAAVGIVGASLGILRLFVPGLVGTILSLFENISNDPSIQGRTDDYASTEKVIADHLWWGRGFGTYLPSRYGPIDNQYLGTIVDNGYVGLAALVALFAVAVATVAVVRYRTRDADIRALAQTLMASVVVVAVASATFDTFAFSIATGLMFVLVGVCGALARITAKNRRAMAGSAECR